MILVTGATGLVGRALIEVLQSGRRPWIELSQQERGAGWDSETRRVVACDVTDRAALDAALRGGGGTVRSVIHLAGVAPGRKPVRADHEVAAMSALLEVSRARGVERFVYLSASGASASAAHPWLRAKGEAEALLGASGLPHVVARAGLVTSAESPLLHALSLLIREGAKLRLPLLRAGRFHPITAGDLAILLATALDHHAMVGKTLDVGVAPAIALEELLTAIALRLGRPLDVTKVPFTAVALADALAVAGGAALSDADSLVRWCAVAEAGTLADYDRLLPMRRAMLIDDLRSYPWGMPAPRPGQVLPLAPAEPAAGALPLFIPGAAMRDAARLGRTDPFGRTDEPGASDKKVH